MGMDSVTSTKVGALERREIRKSHSCHLLLADLRAVFSDVRDIKNILWERRNSGS